MAANENKRGYIIEYIEGKTFSKLVYSERYEFSKPQIYEVCDKLLDILDILYKNNIVHRDIRLPNVIQKENKEIALIDFGLARYIDNDDYTQDIDFWYLGDFYFIFIIQHIMMIMISIDLGMKN